LDNWDKVEPCPNKGQSVTEDALIEDALIVTDCFVATLLAMTAYEFALKVLLVAFVISILSEL
jgi:hypothetical protein